MIIENPEGIDRDDLEVLQERNEEIVDLALEEHPKTFSEIFLEDGSRVAMFYNSPLIHTEEFSKYRYIGLSKYGLTEFNASCRRPLGYDVIVKAISKLIGLSDGEEILDLPVSEWRKPIRNRINKGLFKLEAIIRTVYITGRNIPNRVRDFYERVLYLI